MSNKPIGISKRLLERLRESFPMLHSYMGGTVESLGVGCSDAEAFRKELNRVLRMKLGNLPVDTLEIRILLDDYDNLEYWYMNLTGVVLPFLDENMNGNW